MKTEDLARKKLEALNLAGEREVPALFVPSDAALESAPLEEIPSPAPRIEIMPKPLPKAALKTETSSNKGDLAAAQGRLAELRAEIGEDCRRCRLCEKRTKLVFGVGNPQADLMFVGEAPGRDEDLKGEPFVGRAGQLLTKIIEAMKYKREDIYIANVVKCRPPENRNPAPDEIATCEPFLLRQIEIIQPKVIVGLGNFAVQTLLQTEAKITGLRGRFHPWPSAVVKEKFDTSLPEASIGLMPTYHPAFLLRNPAMKRPVWEDMQKVMERLGK
jgi:uracil-DNA glycosylase